MSLSIGIVGLPNVGKSTLFNALTKKGVPAENYPFCTIDPSVGIVPVPDERLTKLSEISKSKKTIPAVVEFVDIAGLVKGASEGAGLGNKFLSHIREVDVICHVVRNFADASVVHVAGEINPLHDKDIIETELILADLQTLDKQTEPFGYATGKPQGRFTKDDFTKWSLILKLKEGLNNGHNAREIITDSEEKDIVRDLQLLSMKPVLYVMNVSEQELSNLTQDSRNFGLANDNSGNQLNTVVICAKTEAELASLSPEEQKEYLAALGVSASGLDLLIQKTYQLLGLISFLTTGEKEARAWTIRAGMKAPEAAGTIHTDFAKKFIKADVVSYEDFINPMREADGPASPNTASRGGWKKAREIGKVRQEGKEYIVKDGDVIEFKIGS